MKWNMFLVCWSNETEKGENLPLVLKRFNMKHCKPISMTIEFGKHFQSLPEEETDRKYPSIAKTIEMFDICYNNNSSSFGIAIGILLKFMSKPGKEYLLVSNESWDALKEQSIMVLFLKVKTQHANWLNIQMLIGQVMWTQDDLYMDAYFRSTNETSAGAAKTILCSEIFDWGWVCCVKLCNTRNHVAWTINSGSRSKAKSAIYLKWRISGGNQTFEKSTILQSNKAYWYCISLCSRKINENSLTVHSIQYCRRNQMIADVSRKILPK